MINSMTVSQMADCIAHRINSEQGLYSGSGITRPITGREFLDEVAKAYGAEDFPVIFGMFAEFEIWINGYKGFTVDKLGYIQYVK